MIPSEFETRLTAPKVPYPCTCCPTEGRSGLAGGQGTTSCRVILPPSRVHRFPRRRRPQALIAHSTVRATDLPLALLVLTRPLRLVDDLGLKSTLSQYNVPRDDLPKIAELAVGDKEDPVVPKAVALLESIYA